MHAGDAFGAKNDLMHYRQGTILYGDEKTQDFMQTGEMILVGRAWRLVEAPAPGGTSSSTTASSSAGGVQISDDIKDLVDKLKPIDDKYKNAKTSADVIEYNLARGAVLEQIVAALKGKELKEREEWIKQVADCFSTAAQNGGKASMPKLTDLRAKVVVEAPNSNLAAYVEYREMSAEYALRLSDNPKPAQMPKLQEDWKDRLTKFVQEYPASEDTPDAIMQLGMVAEFVGKETEAKNWYSHLVKNFDKNSMAPKAAGAIRRLSIEGEQFELNSLVLGTKASFDVKSLKGKTCVVYYWASWNGQCDVDFAKLKSVISAYSGRGVELICVNLDNTDAEANRFLQANPLSCIHLHQPGGLESPPAVNYGIMVLPNMFIVGPDGKVLNRNAQVATVEDELKKLVK